MSDKSSSLSSKVSSLRAGASALLPIYPETFEDVVRLARMACIAGMIKPMRIGYGDDARTEDSGTVEARATMIILEGMEVGLPPMQAIQLIAMINGRMTVHSEGVPAVLLSKGFKIKQEFSGIEFQDDFTAVCTLTRPDGDSIRSAFSVKDAKDAGLWDASATVTKYGKTKPNDSAWHLYPKRMLWARALGFAAKDKGADALRGLMVREEMDDMIRSQKAFDITPEAPRLATAGLDAIPEIQDSAPPHADTEAPSDSGPPPHDGEFANRVLSELAGRLAKAKSDAARIEVWEGMSELVGSLPDGDQRRAEAVFEGRA